MWDLGHTCNSLLGGLVSITAGCTTVEIWASVVIGFIGAFFYHGASCLMRRLKIDDPLDAFAVHGACGLWGCIAVGFFCTCDYSYTASGKDCGVFYGGGLLLATQIVGPLPRQSALSSLSPSDAPLPRRHDLHHPLGRRAECDPLLGPHGGRLAPHLERSRGRRPRQQQARRRRLPGHRHRHRRGDGEDHAEEDHVCDGCGRRVVLDAAAHGRNPNPTQYAPRARVPRCTRMGERGSAAP